MRAAFVGVDSEAWRETLSLVAHDVYHLPAYAAFAARRQHRGEAVAFIAEEQGNRLFIPLIVRAIPDPTEDGTVLRDAISPRGYPGPLLFAEPGGALNDFADRALAAFRDAMRTAEIITAFIRMHPLLPFPRRVLLAEGTLVEHGDSVSIDLRLPDEQLWRQTRENHRRDITRARRQGYVARMDQSWASLSGFVEIYQQSMDRLGSSAFWRLSQQYVDDFRASLEPHVHLCVVELGNELAAAALLTEVDGIVEYHLAGTRDSHIGSSPSKVIVDFARSWAKSRGNRDFHLGGSLMKGDALNHFKLGFSPRQHPVVTWRVVTDRRAYQALVERWEAVHAEAAEPENGFFPAYRNPMPRSR